MDYKLEVVVIPVTDMDRAKAFYGDVVGFHVDVDHRAGEDFEAARADLGSRGVAISDPFHFGPQGQTPGLDPERRNYGSFASFNDPDGNGWLVQEVRR